MTFMTAFKRLQEKFGNVDASLLDDMAIQITLSDEDCGGTFYAAVKDHKLAVEPYDYKDNDAVLDVTRKALTSILEGKTDIDKTIEAGDLSVKGDLEKVAQIKSAIKIPEKKTPAKKAPAKKTAAAKKTETAKKTEAPKKTVRKKTAEPAKAAEPVKPAVKKVAEKKAPVKKTAPKKAAETKTTEVKTETK